MNKNKTPEDRQKTEILSIVIPAYNSAKLLLRCLEALEKQTAPRNGRSGKSAFEVTVVDDGSTDNTTEILRQFQAERPLRGETALNLRCTTIPNSGPGNARNAGVALSAGIWIGFLDADVIPHPDWVKNALKLIAQKPPEHPLREAGAFEGRTEVTQRERATPFTHQTENTDGGRYPTCNFLVRRSLAHFYPKYQIPFREDTDLAFSILESGYSIVFAPELIVEHPPLVSGYSRPLVLARRYYYDGLLARRFPKRYRNELDAHQVFGLKIPHLKKRLYTMFVFFQTFFFGTIILRLPETWLFFSGSTYLAGLTITAAAGLRYANLRGLSLKDWFVFFGQLHLLPWVMGFSLLRGRRAFRNEPEFAGISALETN